MTCDYLSWASPLCREPWFLLRICSNAVTPDFVWEAPQNVQFSSPFCICPPASPYGVVPAAPGTVPLLPWGYHKLEACREAPFIWMKCFLGKLIQLLGSVISVLRFPSGPGDSSHKKDALKDPWNINEKKKKTNIAQTGMKAGEHSSS